jgi:hypothetical protein
MESNNNDILNYKEKKYPRSKNNHQCIGPCYHKNTTFVHPITAEYITSTNATCPIYDEGIDEDGNIVIQEVDECMNPTQDKDIKDDSYYNNISVPIISLDNIKFLRKFYNIYTFESALDWIEKKKSVPFRTKNRIIEAAWKAYGKELDIIDQRTTDYYLDVIKKRWINYIVSEIGKYISIEKKKNKITINKEGKENPEDHRIEKTNYILDKFITRDDIYKFLIRYNNYYKKTWDHVDNHTNQILLDLIEYIKKKINISNI